MTQLHPVILITGFDEDYSNWKTNKKTKFCQNVVNCRCVGMNPRFAWIIHHLWIMQTTRWEPTINLKTVLSKTSLALTQEKCRYRRTSSLWSRERTAQMKGWDGNQPQLQLYAMFRRTVASVAFIEINLIRNSEQSCVRPKGSKSASASVILV